MYTWRKITAISCMTILLYLSRIEQILNVRKATAARVALPPYIFKYMDK